MKDNMIDYAAFAHAIDTPFDPYDMIDTEVGQKEIDKVLSAIFFLLF